MGLFDLPTGELELLMDGKWQSVMFTDRLDDETVKETVSAWSEDHKVESARYTAPGYTVPYTVWGKMIDTEGFLRLHDIW